jgi:hypothetical protein
MIFRVNLSDDYFNILTDTQADDCGCIKLVYDIQILSSGKQEWGETHGEFLNFDK